MTVKRKKLGWINEWRIHRTQYSTAVCVCLCLWAKSIQLRPTLCDPVDHSPPGSSVHGILQARILEWVATPSSRGIFPSQGSNPLLCLLHWQATSLPLVPPGKPIYIMRVVNESESPVQLFVAPWTTQPWNSPGQNTGVGSLSLLQGIFPTQGLNPSLLHCRWVLYQLSRKGSSRRLEWVAYSFSRGSSQLRNQTRVSCIAGGFFTNHSLIGQGSPSIIHSFNYIF